MNESSMNSPSQILSQVKMDTTSPTDPMPKENKFAGTLCPKDFNFQASFKMHKTFHFGDTSLKCPDCGEHYKEKGFIEKEMHKRLMSNSNEKVSKYVTSRSSKQKEINTNCMSSSDQVVPQIKTNAASATIAFQKEKNKFACKLCQKDFSFEAYFKMHKMFHFGEVSVNCPTCGKHYRKKRFIGEEGRKCLITTNSDKVDSLSTASPSKQEATDNSCMSSPDVVSQVKMDKSPTSPIEKEKKFVCKLCQKDFNFEVYFKMHKMFHLGDVSVNCANCGEHYQKKGFTEEGTHKCLMPTVGDKIDNIIIASSSK